MNIRKVAGSEMFDFLPAVFLVMLGRALYRRRSLFDRSSDMCDGKHDMFFSRGSP